MTVNTELYRAEESRPKRFCKKNEESNTKDDYNEIKYIFNTYGFPIEEAVQVLFDGLAQEKLYIGPMEIKKVSSKNKLSNLMF
jgi:hypothetical protein